MTNELPTATRIAALEDQVLRLTAENVRLTNEVCAIGTRSSMDREEIDALTALLAQSRADVVRLTAEVEAVTDLAEQRRNRAKDAEHALIRERSRADVLAAEVRAKRALCQFMDRERVSWSVLTADDKAEYATDRTNALDAATKEQA